MHRAAFAFVMPLLGWLLFSASLGLGQTKAIAQQDSADRQFAVIDASLVEVANSALEAAAVPRAETGSKVRASQSETLTPSFSLWSAPKGTNQRVDALRPLVQPILSKEGVPDQLAAVIQVESGGNPLALSPKGARGLWQLMPGTARRYGLRVDERLDERLDLEKATTSAARYLRDLRSQFGSWPLALAAYNTGELNLQRAIDRARSRDFQRLSALEYLPAETRNYVPTVLAAMGTQLPPIAAPTQNARPAKLVYATSENSGQ